MNLHYLNATGLNNGVQPQFPGKDRWDVKRIMDKRVVRVGKGKLYEQYRSGGETVGWMRRPLPRLSRRHFGAEQQLKPSCRAGSQLLLDGEARPSKLERR